MANPIGNSDTCGESDQSAGETHDGRFSGHEQCNQSVGSAEWLVGEVVSYRGEAVVLEPPELRARVAQRARELGAELRPSRSKA